MRSGYTQSQSVNEEGTTSVSSRIQSDGMGRMGEIDEGESPAREVRGDVQQWRSTCVREQGVVGQNSSTWYNGRGVVVRCGPFYDSMLNPVR